jgi:hypothetical protein
MTGASLTNQLLLIERRICIFFESSDCSVSSSILARAQRILIFVLNATVAFSDTIVPDLIGSLVHKDAQTGRPHNHMAC